MSSTRLRFALPAAALLTAAPLAVFHAMAGPLEDGDRCASVATPAYESNQLGTGTTSVGCGFHSTANVGYVARGGFRLRITHNGKTTVIRAAKGYHCGAVGTIRKGDDVYVEAGSTTTRVSTVTVGKNAHC